ncbi:hypothetical protein F2P56_018753 [Juglans regia]|uniref:RNase H type-1 domain-containing protein n=2 Tax=Juglans regia TaxID=51240 RepID=A0A833X6Y6_JUGRE|nr:uncharacterized protein LOC108997851 [Juglans regia]KAF5462772.1 hypothetical protein F2P56_018753 [Juglans regia]
MGYYKLNWDATIAKEASKVAIGAVIRDQMGLVVGTLQAQKVLFVDSFMAEAYALMLAVIFCRDMGIQDIIMEGDALQVIHVLNKATTDWSQGGVLIANAKMILNTLHSWSGSHVKREGNKAAHILARNTPSLEEDLYVLEDYPACIHSIILSEMM